MPDLANTLIGGRYRLERRLGAGGMGEVWAATDTRLDRPVALKILRSSMAADAAVRLRFESEARSAARLHHPNVVAVFDAGSDAGDAGTAQLWLVMERLPGRTLADSMAHGPLSPAEARSVAMDVLSGLSAAHAAKLVHRDIKPSNLLQAVDGTWKIADFGIAKPLDSAVDLTATGATIGTPSYLSPEQLEGRPATPASDLWAVGVVLYEALAGRKPFVGDTPFAVAHAVRSGQPQAIAALRSDVDPALSSAIAAALAKAPDQRPRDAATMAEMLSGAASTAVGPAAPSPPAAAQMPRTRVPPPVLQPARDAAPGSRGRLLGWITAGALVVAAAVLIALVATGSFDNGRSPSSSTTTTTTRAPTSAGSSPSTSAGSTAPTAPATTATTATTTPTSASTTTSTSRPTTTTTNAPKTTAPKKTAPKKTAPKTTSPKTTSPTTKP